MVEQLSSFRDALRDRHFGVTAIRLGYSRLDRNGEMSFDGMCYISWPNWPLLYAFITEFNGHYFDDRVRRSGQSLRVCVSDTGLDAGRSNRNRMLGGMRMNEEVYDCPHHSRNNQIYSDEFR